jgi:hypothetical protein
MNPEEAKRLAIRIVNSWHGGPNVDEWASELAEMDAGTAGTTFIRLRRELNHVPSVAHFWHAYRQLVTPANEPLPCDECDDSGWISAHTDAHDYATPCPICERGRQAAKLEMRASWKRHPTARGVGTL